VSSPRGVLTFVARMSSSPPPRVVFDEHAIAPTNAATTNITSGAHEGSTDRRDNFKDPYPSQAADEPPSRLSHQ